MKKENNKKKKSVTESPKTKLSPAKKRIFLGITISLPIIFFLFLEISLRIFNYGGNLDLFIEGPEGYENYIRCNPNVARRYFFMQTGVPTPPKQLFLKQKPSNGYRIFVLGESTTAGFPYGSNASFSNILERGLANTFPDKNIEVVNLAMAAVNSYTVLDMLDEIFENSPDAILIYAGHNEYYGAMGVGSVQSIGSSRWLTVLYLNLRSFKTFLLVRDFVGWLKNQVSKILYKGTEVDPSQTLMARVVAEQTIPYGSSLYEAGKEQFKSNLEAILEKANEHKVPVVLSELVSNQNALEPFISVEDDKGKSANTFFTLARQFEERGDYKSAKENYINAKDMDALRFRAPEDFNETIHELADKYSAPVVQMKNIFEENSPNGIIGKTLMLEHVHPNKNGYFLMAKAFYEELQKNNFISSEWKADLINEEKDKGITGLDSVFAELVIRQLKGSWPFQPKSLPNRSLENFQPKNILEELSFRILKGDNFSLESAHMELGKYYESRNEFDNAFAEYNALITSIPQEFEFYRRAALVLIEKKDYDKASQLLHRSMKYKETGFAYKWIGQIAFMNNDFDKAIVFLTKADQSDAQVVFNLCRAYYSSNQWYKGEEYFGRLRNMSPKSEYIAYINKMRSTIILKNRAGNIN